MSPCFTPMGQLNQSVAMSFNTTLDFGFLNKEEIAQYILPQIPIFESLKSKRFLSTESKAFLKSIKLKNVDFP